MNTIRLIVAGLLVAVAVLEAQEADLSATEIVRRADQKMRGETSQSQTTMTIVRPDWSRTLSIKSWMKGEEYALIRITAPPREAEQAFLKRGSEIWHWVPSVDRVIKIPPSMMSQSWMGSDFTNDDLVKEASIVSDYNHELAGTDTIRGHETWVIDMTPKPDAPVVWGKVKMWIAKGSFIQLRIEQYDEDGELVQTQELSEIETMDGREVPTKIEVGPEDEEGHRTVLNTSEMEFNEQIADRFFSLQNLKRQR
jgi:outer membrane lipoprotein-sorting protein